MRKTEREIVWNKYNKHCAYCGCSIEYRQLEVDHLIPRHRGGEDSHENYMPSCKSCNTTRDSYLIEEFRQRLIDDVVRLRRDSSKFRILEKFGVVGQKLHKVEFYFEKAERI
jgi:5-methylcytosine-specific restriction endonuclease McrA